MYKCEIIADSLSPQGNRLTTFLVTYPRIVHAEMLRHRMFSRNVASSRAIPFEKMVKDVEENPFIPIAWQKSHKGMQGNEYFTSDVDIKACRKQWLDARDSAVLHSSFMYHDGTTKQLCNRVLEPFVWTTELITTSEEGLQNFFDLRCPKYVIQITNEDNLIESRYFRSKRDYNHECHKRNWHPFTDEKDWRRVNQSQAEIHIQKIAEMMWDEFNSSTPKQLKAGEWHIPDLGHEWDNTKLYELSDYKMGDDTHIMDKAIEQTKIKIATAHCAKISYDNFGTKVDYEADIKLHDRLLESHHMSPFEHCARAMSDIEYYSFIKGKSNANWDTDLVTDNTYEISAQFDHNVLGWCNNFKGFIQYRYLVEND